jgi:chitodextrinase
MGGLNFYGLSVTTKTLLNGCDYPAAGTYYAKVIVERGGSKAEKRVPVAARVPTTTTTTDRTAPSVPSGFIAKALSSSEISLSWSTSTDNVAVKGYKIYRNGVSVLTAYGTSIINSRLTPSTTYQYTIAAFDAANNVSQQSGVVTVATLHPDVAAPSTPQNITVWKLNTNTQRAVVWSPSTDDVKVVGYRIYRNGTLLTSTTNNFYNIPVTTLVPYDYAVAAYDASKNESPKTNAVTPDQYSVDTQPPTAPSGFTATALSVTQVQLSWNPSQDNSRVVGYRIYRNGIKIAAAAGTSFKNTSLIPGTAYSYQVEAYDIVGLNSARSAVSVTLPPDTQAPTAPTNLVARGISISQIRLTWRASTDNAKVTGYKIFRDGIQIATALGTTFTNINLPPSTSYRYTVSAYDASQNNSAQTASVTGTTLTPDFTPPTTPTNLRAAPYSQTRINLSWTAATDNVRIAGYKIFRDLVYIGSTSALSYASAGLAAGTTYSYTVMAYDSSGNTSLQSPAVTGTTLP